MVIQQYVMKCLVLRIMQPQFEILLDTTYSSNVTTTINRWVFYISIASIKHVSSESD